MLGKLAEEKEKEAANVDRIRMLSNSPSFRRPARLSPCGRLGCRAVIGLIGFKPVPASCSGTDVATRRVLHGSM
jgi:hypothetical protein